MRESIAARSEQLAPHVGNDEGLRAAIERSALLRLGKAAANRTLGTLGAGDTLKARFTLSEQ